MTMNFALNAFLMLKAKQKKFTNSLRQFYYPFYLWVLLGYLNKL